MGSAASFPVSDGSVWWGTFRLSERDREDLLSFFERHGDQPEARRAWLDLHEAHVKAGGIERVSSLSCKREAA